MAPITSILSYIPNTPLDIIANQRQGTDIIRARQRISGYWSHNRFYNYYYEPSDAYFKKLLRYRMPLFTKKLKSYGKDRI